TPLPRTLALTLYGDLDVSYLRPQPPGRGPLITKWIRSPQKREELYRRIFQRIKEEGDQCYVVAPAIETPEKLDLRAVEELYTELQEIAPEEIRIALLHGRMSAAERRTIMEAFRQGEIHMLVTTTVVEVGVDVPNANLMVIEDADRFGLSQLHQLRGRIHRSTKEAYCFLITRGQVGRDARKRMQVMVESADGFELAQKDLELRGSGELTGVRQHGRIRFQYVRLEDPSDETRSLIQTIRDEVRKLVQEDPNLDHPEHRTLRLYLHLRRELQQVIPVG
ncbi:MAG: DNA helicase RecG, partial [Candidatus Hydrothermae bacterium]|nr:DNA helicase RecG [Candidatus Hydrothermae bacterium]